MENIIKEVLDQYQDTIVAAIVKKLNKQGVYTEFSDDELEEQEAKKGWVCQTCGKSTFETDYDYLVHPKLHLGCALKEEMGGKDIKEQYHEASSRLYEEDTRREKNWSQKKHEDKVFIRQIEDCGTQLSLLDLDHT